MCCVMYVHVLNDVGRVYMCAVYVRLIYYVWYDIFIGPIYICSMTQGSFISVVLCRAHFHVLCHACTGLVYVCSYVWYDIFVGPVYICSMTQRSVISVV